MIEKRQRLPFVEFKDLEWCDLRKYRRVFKACDPVELVHSLYCAVVACRFDNGLAKNNYVEDLLNSGPTVAVTNLDSSDFELLPEWSETPLPDAIKPLSLDDVIDVFHGIDDAPVPEDASPLEYPADFALLDNRVFMRDAALLTVNMEATDKEILSALKKFLPAYRKELTSRGANLGFDRFSESLLNNIIDYRLIEYFHIQSWAGVRGKRVKDATLARYLFGCENNAHSRDDPEAFFAKTVKPFALRFSNPYHVANLGRWAATHYRE